MTGPVVRSAVLVRKGPVRHRQSERTTDRLPAITRLPLDEPPRSDLGADVVQPTLIAGHRLLPVVDVCEEVAEDDPEQRNHGIVLALAEPPPSARKHGCFHAAAPHFGTATVGKSENRR